MNSNIKEVPDICSNCGAELDEDWYRCPNCSEALCKTCICLCTIIGKRSRIEEEFDKDLEDNNEVTSLDGKRNPL